MSINTVLFDLDGTLIDTNELIISSFMHTLNHYYPEQYKREDVLAFMGPPLYDTFVQMDKERVHEMIDTYRTHNLSHHDELVTEFAGVFETVKWLHDQKYKLAIVTTKQINTVMLGLKLTKLDQFFDVIVAIDDVQHAKPHPEPVEKALVLLNAQPEEAVMVGDNHHDILSGKNAGTKTAGVAWSAKGREHIASYEPDVILEEMKDLIPWLGGKEQ
ncbi:pyrophosphatase PpaX [Priestia flexa]|jgi:pyrophosphatase PpaX|uniref:Pyrophosphatase PpaX n=2 Tax=Priestia TaxID=2800373 RepID=A0A0V8JLI0_9BACI|nr:MULTISPECIES: pyrophosphatase PpaX [Bacillaceae]KSU87918.1 pyrophosphatase [Priestia veravalensis]KZB91661.1 pyrophosphatase [Bacillus sp. VT 712]MBN8253020.1 pyrophosphatase PpaX [Priestia flexa]MBN8433662.1 pyrophosphatase PpaX [Priestia flexa]MBY6086966.1 pyrophosphatase PpaX [Priestia flexa]